MASLSESTGTKGVRTFCIPGFPRFCAAPGCQPRRCEGDPPKPFEMRSTRMPQRRATRLRNTQAGTVVRNMVDGWTESASRRRAVVLQLKELISQ